jgi:hypothetical protein
MVNENPISNPVDEILDFLLSQPTPEQILRLRASESAQERLRYLLDGNRNNTLKDAERLELDNYVQFENLVTQLKTRARFKLSEQTNITFPKDFDELFNPKDISFWLNAPPNDLMAASVLDLNDKVKYVKLIINEILENLDFVDDKTLVIKNDLPFTRLMNSILVECNNLQRIIDTQIEYVMVTKSKPLSGDEGL